MTHMRFIKTVVAFLGAAALAGCGSSLNTGTSGTSSTNTSASSPSLVSCTGATSTTARFLFAAGLGDNALVRYNVNATGTLQPLDCAPFAAAPGLSQPTGLDYDAGPNLLFVSNYTSNTVAAFQFDTQTAVLSPVSGSPFAAGINPWSVTMDSLHHYLYVADGSSTPDQSISAYQIGGSISTLTPVPTSSSANGPAFALASDPGAPYLFAANYTPTDTISAYAISGTTGALSLIGDYPAGGAYPRSVAVDPSGAYVYVANTDRIGDQCGPGTPSGNTITGFSIGVGGVLSPMGTFASGLAPQSLAITSVGNTEFLYSANYCSNDIGIYRINTGGALSLVGTTQEPANSGPHDLAVTPDGFLYVVNYMADTVDAYQIGTNGLLTALGTYPTSDNPAAVVVTP
ncbi:MAG: beta-propeller fold lactonase family protein [Acidiferrobacteraceae bacterium]